MHRELERGLEDLWTRDEVIRVFLTFTVLLVTRNFREAEVFDPGS